MIKYRMSHIIILFYLLVLLPGCAGNHPQSEINSNLRIISDSFRVPSFTKENIPEIPLYNEAGNDIILLSSIPAFTAGPDSLFPEKAADSILKQRGLDTINSQWYYFQVDNFTADSSWLLTIEDSIVDARLFYRTGGNNILETEIKKATDTNAAYRNKYPIFTITIAPSGKQVFLLNLTKASSKISTHLTFKAGHSGKRYSNELFYAGIFFTLVLIVLITTVYFLIYTRDVVNFVFIIYFIITLIFYVLPYIRHPYNYIEFPLFLKFLALISGIAWCMLLTMLATHSFSWSRQTIPIVFLGSIGTGYPLWESLFNFSAYYLWMIVYLGFELFFLHYLFKQNKRLSNNRIIKSILALISLIPLLYLLLIELNSINLNLFYNIGTILRYATPSLFYAILIMRFLMQREGTRASTIAKALDTQKELSGIIIKSLELERKRFADDLHDELGSNLAALKIQVTRASSNEEKESVILPLIDSMSESARRIAHNLMPPRFKETSLEIILNEYFNSLNSSGNISFKFYYSGKNSLFSKEDELMFYRIVIELTHNCIKHSKADSCDIQLLYHDDYLEIYFEDNGVGFPEQTTENVLHTIKSRVLYLSGTLKIDSNANGAIIIIRIPTKKK